MQPLRSGETCCIGFCENEMKWYGWSHRAIFGFGIGSKVSKGDCAYNPANKDDFAQSVKDFWVDGSWRECETPDILSKTELTSLELDVVRDGEEGVLLETKTVFIGANRNLTSAHFEPYPKTFGKGEWVAETLADAKQMAIDFAGDVG